MKDEDMNSMGSFTVGEKIELRDTIKNLKKINNINKISNRIANVNDNKEDDEGNSNAYFDNKQNGINEEKANGIELLDDELNLNNRNTFPNLLQTKEFKGHFPFMKQKTNNYTNSQDSNIAIHKRSSNKKKTSSLEGIIEIKYSKLEFGKMMSEGGFGRVYAGSWKGNEVAIKEFKYNEFESFETQKMNILHEVSI